MNLHDKRFFKNENIIEDWQFVAVPNQYRTGRLKASIDAGGYFVTLQSIHPIDSGPGRPVRHDIITFRGKTPADLREKILQQFPQAVFTTGDPDPQPDLKAEHAAQVRKEREQQAAIAERKQFERNVTFEHRKIAASLIRQEQLNVTCANLSAFASDPTFGGESWTDWFRQRIGFFSWPNNSWKNRDILIQFCESKGQLVPLAGEIAEAMLYLLQHKHFYMQPSYKRSEQDEFEAVRPFEREILPIEEITDNDIRRIVQALTGKFGLPVTVSIERLRAIGIPETKLEVVFQRLRQMHSPDPTVQWKSSAELKSGLQDMRNSRRGHAARNRNSTLSGY